MIKKYFYILSWMVLGFLLSFLVHAGFEIATINYAWHNNIILTNYMVYGGGYCVLPKAVQIMLIVLGLVGGFFAGRYFWRVIYIEKRYQPKWKNFFKNN